jgi:GNAT superfamily N-acetyltransferase
VLPEANAMWTSARALLMEESILSFLRTREYECVQAGEAVQRARSVPADSAVVRIYVHRCPRTPAFKAVDGIAVQWLDGAVHLILPPSPRDDAELAALLKRTSNIHRIAGTKQAVMRIADKMAGMNWHITPFLLMHLPNAPSSHSASDVPMVDGKPVRCVDASLEDLNALVSLHLEYEREELALYSADASETEIRMRSLLANQIVCMACAGDEAIGKVNTNARGMYFDQIGGFYVKKEWRSMGIGTNLLQYLLRRIEAEDRNAVLFVRHDNLAALRVYRHLGFLAVGEYAIGVARQHR